MENNSKSRRRLSHTLSNRLHQKRHSASPQNRLRASAASESPKNAPKSPTVDLTNSLENVESTPPHKNSVSLDDSVDFSPRLDISLSPSCLFSQSLATESPEVGWRWNRNQNNNNRWQEQCNTTTDSGFNSAESTAGGSKWNKHPAGESKHVTRRNQIDNEQWRAQQQRARELLRERCDKLHRQLEEVATQPKAASTVIGKPVAPKRAATISQLPAPPPPASTAPPVNDAALNDFLNDSDTDCLLLEATQQLELKNTNASAAPAATTPTSHHKEKRTSFYMKFLEDDFETDDFFAAMDEAVLQAANAKKPRISLQRYKSMPTTTAESTNSVNTVSNSIAKGSSTASNNLVNTPPMRRHASSHVLSPVTSHVRSKLFGSRK